VQALRKNNIVSLKCYVMVSLETNMNTNDYIYIAMLHVTSLFLIFILVFDYFLSKLKLNKSIWLCTANECLKKLFCLAPGANGLLFKAKYFCQASANRMMDGTRSLCK